jgi:hypothetical protein
VELSPNLSPWLGGGGTFSLLLSSLKLEVQVFDYFYTSFEDALALLLRVSCYEELGLRSTQA